MCGATQGGLTLDGIDLTKQTVIQGVVVRAAESLPGAYVRLLDSDGEFVAEVPTSATGHFRFFAAPGSWTLRTIAPHSPVVDWAVVATRGEVAEVTVTLG